MVQIRRHIHLLLYFDIVKHKQCTGDYTNKQVDGCCKESKGQKEVQVLFFLLETIVILIVNFVGLELMFQL